MISVRAVYGITFLVLGLYGCAEMEPKPFEPSQGHIQSDSAGVETDDGQIPEVVTRAPVLPEPEPAKPLEKYTVVVNEVPVKELLFALARDADLNVDLYPGLQGKVTLNAVDQTLPQILDRISRQIKIRYKFKDNNIIITPDDPFFKSYTIDYVNMTRKTTASNQLTTQISTTGSSDVGESGGNSSGSGSGNNNSTTDVQSVSNNLFWQRLVASIAAIIGDPVKSNQDGSGKITSTNNIVASPESGILNVRATQSQHEYISEHISRVVESAQRQVLIQATIVEVQLSDQYQTGIDWSAMDIFDTSIDIASNTLAPTPTGVNRLLSLTYSGADVTAAIRLLEQFGSTNVLSSPQLMVLNNQTAVLKVVENFVYFEIESTTNTTQGVINTTFDSEARTVPVGIVMTVTPQISDSGNISLNVRPTVSRVAETKQDPGPALVAAQVGNLGILDEITNEVPQIEVRELESMLRLSNGQVGVLGGLMLNEESDTTDGVPGLSDIPLLGRAFRTDTKTYRKTELIIFLKPVIVKNPDINSDLQQYRSYLKPVDNQDNSEAY